MLVFYLTLVFLIITIIIYRLPWVFIAVCRLLSGCSEQGLLFVVVCGFLTEVASLAAELGLWGPAGLVTVTCGL